MEFSYDNLSRMARNGDRVGNWKGYPVFAVKKMALDQKSEGAIFIVYDDDNILVRRIGNSWYSFGQCSESGQVMEWDRRKYSIYPEPTVYRYDTQAYESKAQAAPSKSASEKNSTAASDVMGDVKIGLDIDALLCSVRTMTVDSLLEGFNYGLDVQE